MQLLVAPANAYYSFAGYSVLFYFLAAILDRLFVIAAIEVDGSVKCCITYYFTDAVNVFAMWVQMGQVL